MARLDVYMTERGLAPSREKAKQLITAGKVTVGGRVVTKPSAAVNDGDEVIAAAGEEYVGRGALKLERAFEVFGVEVGGKVCADIGASTGGFTEVLLRRGAAEVYAVDVGHGQLAEKLRNDPRVKNCEGTNVRYLPADFFGGWVTFACCDVSFISLTLIMPALAAALPYGADIVTLIKPQFEAGREALGKGGIVRGKKAHIETLTRLTEFFAAAGLSVQGLTYSPICGGDGNIEYLAHLVKAGVPPRSFDIKAITEKAFENGKQENRK